MEGSIVYVTKRKHLRHWLGNSFPTTDLLDHTEQVFPFMSKMEMGSPEAAKKRILPMWMMKKAAQPVQEAEIKPKRRKKSAAVGSETVYCMNEAELVDMALCILAENSKSKEANISSSEDKDPEPQQAMTNHHESPMSDSNRDPSPAVGSKFPKGLDALSCCETTKSEDDDDDALKYVREIFFT
ncbi:cell cycle regulator of non-homologous end joining isoform X2 [Sceloporus undulatus]|uniref:cell cycle regulator of non-homologous end joining isoform X2 n=1 Tax=Sceloporus undulatus TaxID=8520 RepID=UPI001C4AE6B0|nr:cell cycle regulator of non-homologous end joining isoform X2 [Sceloporus undulatus]